MKQSLKIKLAASLAFFTAFAAISSSIAWFVPSISLTNTGDVTGATEGAYYAYGEGTESKPFGITRPRHLYNLAWLQYLGTYNKASDNGKPYYFELGDNVDMTGWTLPPIGNETNPFYGNFNGKGYVISNLTISNDFTNDLGKHPSSLTSFTQPHILGFFGVIGKYGDANPSAYSSSANEFINTGLTGLTVKTVLQDSLIGIAAGYVDAKMQNVAVDSSTLNVAYTGGATTSYGGHTNNISDFSLVGYTTKKASIKKAEESIYAVNVSSGYEFNATDQGNSTGWGGSIDMMSVTKRLQTIRDTASNTRFDWKKTRTYHNDVPDANDVVTDTQSGNNNYTRMVNNDDTIGHFNFITGSNDVNNRYALLGGGHYQTNVYYDFVEHSAFQITNGTQYLTLNGSNIDKTTTQSEGKYWALTDNGKLTTKVGDTYYYLRNNNGTLQATDNANNASFWTIDDSGSQREISSGNYCIKYGTNNFELVTGTATGTGSPYSIKYQNSSNYLINDGTSGFATSSSEALIWEFSNYNTTGNTTIYTTINGTRYYLNVTSGGNWWSRTYSLSLSTSSTSFTWGTNGNYRRLYYATGGWNNTNYYLIYNNSTWSINTSTNYANLTITPTTFYSFVTNISKTASNGSIKGPDEAINNSKAKEGMDYSENDVTYFPLSTVNNTSDFKPADNNTAYVIGGSSLTSNVTYDNNVTNVRFGYYPISNYINNDYNVSTGQFTHVYTINNNMQKEEITNSTAYERLADAKTNLGAVMKSDGTNVYGLHFMAAEISMNALTTAKYVKVNKKEYTNYELPVNSIDFHLKEFGYINFMAGSYFPGNSAQSRNDSFFALYQIERLDSNPNKINRIFEVINVYKHNSGNKNYSYVYQLKDTVTGTTYYTKPYKVVDAEGTKEWLNDTTTSYSNNQYETSLPSNYALAFNCARIKKNSLSQNDFLYHAWYFEIPMNDGEFCLGSDSSGVGSYLMYLDIGANAAKTQRTIFYEKFTLTEKNYTYPLGVSLYTLPTDMSSVTTGTTVIPLATNTNASVLIDASDSACMIIKTSSTGTYAIDRNNGDVTLTRANATNAPPRYAGEQITLLHEKNSTTNIVPDYDSSSSSTIKRMQYYDYNVNLQTTTVTTITDKSSDNGTTWTRTIYQKNYTSSNTTGDPSSTYAYDQTLATPLDQRSNIKIYNTNTGVKVTDSAMIYNAAGTTTGLAIDDNSLSNTVILKFKLVQDGGDEYDDDTLFVAVVDTNNTNGIYYLFNQYKITLTPESGTIKITIQNYTTGNTIYFGTTQVTGANQVITITAPANP